ncbi:MAG: magnesium/cobalt transporter CorA [Proteobacteria bacterium]|nr:magnesium/cobalt transporter CorA [Pseudomonadota bacterium]MBU1639248.1 magnesium/cobalt transporter CorA [Pseudomonadota bacterium]
MLEFLKQRSQKASLPPGSAVYVGKERAHVVEVRILDYDRDTYLDSSELNLDEVKRLHDSSTTTWLNIDGLHEVSVVEDIGKMFGLHPLTIEDIVNATQRPKVDIFDDYVYLVVKMPFYDEEEKTVEMEQVSFVLMEHILITFQEKKGDVFDGVRKRVSTNKGRIRKMGGDYLTYALLDAIIDGYFGVLERVGEYVETLELELVVDPRPATLHKIHELKREMILLRKSVWPLREVVSSLQRDEIPFVTDSVAPFFKDLYDHVIQVLDIVETFRDIVSGMLDIYLSSISNKMNEVMKVLTIFAAIFIPLTLVAGIYGMNFNPEKSPYNMPELNWVYGYPFALGLMVVVAGAMLYYFKKKKWF